MNPQWHHIELTPALPEHVHWTEKTPDGLHCVNAQTGRAETFPKDQHRFSEFSNGDVLVDGRLRIRHVDAAMGEPVRAYWQNEERRTLRITVPGKPPATHRPGDPHPVLGTFQVAGDDNTIETLSHGSIPIQRVSRGCLLIAEESAPHEASLIISTRNAGATLEIRTEKGRLESDPANRRLLFTIAAGTGRLRIAQLTKNEAGSWSITTRTPEAAAARSRRTRAAADLDKALHEAGINPENSPLHAAFTAQGAQMGDDAHWPNAAFSGAMPHFELAPTPTTESTLA